MAFKTLWGEKKAQNSSQHKGSENQEEPKWLTATWLTFHLKMCCDCVILSKQKDGKNKTGNASR